MDRDDTNPPRYPPYQKIGKLKMVPIVQRTPFTPPETVRATRKNPLDDPGWTPPDHTHRQVDEPSSILPDLGFPREEVGHMVDATRTWPKATMQELKDRLENLDLSDSDLTGINSSLYAALTAMSDVLNESLQQLMHAYDIVEATMEYADSLSQAARENKDRTRSSVTMEAIAQELYRLVKAMDPATMSMPPAGPDQTPDPEDMNMAYDPYER